MSDEDLNFGTGNDWLLVRSDPITGMKVYIQDMGDGRTAIKKVMPVDPILESAAADRSNNAGRKWGDGQVIGTVPLELYFSTGYADAKKNGDTAWLKRFWNNGDHKKLRTFEGQV
jgi:hypothetical protein